MVPLVQIILALVGSVFGAKLLGIFGITAPSNAGNASGTVSVLSDHPALNSQPASVIGAAVPLASAQKPPAAKQILSDAVNNPWALFGGAFLAFGLVPLIGQGRAALHEASSTVNDVYSEAGRQNAALNDVTNRSRRAKK